VDVRDQGHVVPVLEQGLPDLHAGLGLLLALHRDADQLRARVHAPLDLFNGGGHVARVCKKEGGGGRERERKAWGRRKEGRGCRVTRG
jgi:hypothetical protein